METKRQTAAGRRGAAYAGRRIHMVGVGGAGMRALAEMLIALGADVTGSDACDSGAIRRLAKQGARIALGQNPDNIPSRCDLVVYSAAIDEQNPELLAARRRGLKTIKYSRMLGRLMSERLGIAVAGTHGKSTTAAMVAYVLQAAGAEPSFIIGATVDQLGGPSGIGAGRHFVAEACEFDRSFLNLRPHVASILNIEEDHLDCYADLDAIVEAFRAFAGLIRDDGILIVNGEDAEAGRAARTARCQVQTFGLNQECTWRGENLSAEKGCYTLDVLLEGRPFCRMNVPLPGLHNVYNALAATAMLYCAGLSPEEISRHLPQFTGARRRLTEKATVAGVTVVDDYAHHPTEIQATLKAVRDHYQPRRLVCVFQPHQHSRTRFLLKDFARSFAPADEVIVPEIYFVRDSEREKDCISSEDLVAQLRLHGSQAMYLRTFEEILHRLEETLGEGDLVITMGAGNIWEVADEIVCRLGRHS